MWGVLMDIQIQNCDEICVKCNNKKLSKFVDSSTERNISEYFFCTRCNDIQVYRYDKVDGQLKLVKVEVSQELYEKIKGIWE